MPIRLPYRYKLTRYRPEIQITQRWSIPEHRCLKWILFNPSKATMYTTDNTITVVKRITFDLQEDGMPLYDSLQLYNLIPKRDTHPRKLKTLNQKKAYFRLFGLSFLQRYNLWRIRRSTRIALAWGTISETHALHWAFASGMRIFRDVFNDPNQYPEFYCLGFSGPGPVQHPCHPISSGEKIFQPFPIQNYINQREQRWEALLND